MLFNGEEAPPELDGVEVRCVPATRLAETHGSGFVNMVMLGAVAAALGEPALGNLQEARSRRSARRLPDADVRSAVAEGYAWLS